MYDLFGKANKCVANYPPILVVCVRIKKRQ